ncbi:MAG: SET domain-containing protein [Terriglobales bacterium]
MALIIRSSDIHAAGCYTTAPIRKGERVVEYTGDVVTNAEGDRLYDDKDYTYLFALDGGTHMVDGYGMAMYLNHSCAPNCETDQIDGKIWITAIRNIKPGEELTYDYNLFDGDGDAPCTCGARRCRGTMYSWDEIRKRKKEARKKALREKKAARKQQQKERALARKNRARPRNGSRERAA